MQTKIAIFCSGSGSNAQKIMDHFLHHPSIKVVVLMANKGNAYALERAKAMNVDTFVFGREEFYASNLVEQKLSAYGVDYIILAGFLWLMPEGLIQRYPHKIINIHPALLPKFGGKGMYGMNVHKAVVENKEKESGMTIHFVDSNYDEGKIIFQASCSIEPSDTPEKVAEKVLRLEHAHFPTVIEKVILGN